MESSSDAQDGLITITSGKVDASSERALLKFGATLFGVKAAESNSPNGYRYRLFEKAFGPSTTAKNPLHKFKGVDASSLPPCETELQRTYIGLHSWRRCGLMPISRPYINIHHLKTDVI